MTNHADPSAEPSQVLGLVTTIIPTFNRPDMLVEAVESVLAQTYRSIEIIIVDDGSMDQTPAVAESLVEKHKSVIRFIRKQNSGAGPSREAGRRIARGEFIQYLDSDDLLTPKKFASSVEMMKADESIGAVYGWIQYQASDGTILDKPYKESATKRERLFPRLLADRWWNTNAPLWRRSVCDQIGPWSSLRWSQDWEYDGRAAALDVKLGHLPFYVTIQRQHAGVRQTTAADWGEPDRVKNRRDFFQLLWQHAQSAGIPASDPYRQHFARWAFATARVAARAGMVEEAKCLFDIAEQSAGGLSEVRGGFDVFRSATSVFGWRLTGKLFHFAAAFKRPGRLTMTESFSK